MSTAALAMMVITMVLVTLATGLFFWKVLKTPPKAEPDSFQDNDNVKR
ncbi:MAG: hypothetical protein IT233_13065 [Bacteroidia bacterium]|nr:hypothetical protein [Bacteroidia bacterium]